MKTAMKIVVGTVVLAVALSLLPGLGDARKLKKVGLIVPGPIGDNGWSAAGYQALRNAAKKYGFQASHQENVKPPKAEAALRKFAEAGYDLVYAHMFVYSEAAARVAKAFPKTKFVVIHGTVRNKTNLISYQTMTQGGGFMAGALAALVSKTGKIGALGGRPIPPIADAIAGYVAGAKLVRPDVKVVVEYTGDFNNTTLAREKALAMISQGVDVLVQEAPPAGVAALKAAQEKGVLAIGFIRDQHAIAPKAVLSSVKIDFNQVYDKIAAMANGGKWKGGFLRMGFSQNAVGLAPYHGLADRVTPKMQARLDKVRADLISGKIKAPVAKRRKRKVSFPLCREGIPGNAA
ncbi:MAG: BMP family protein [Nitrospinota bacterium]|nr:BMP family protein [Nitrospinota bacterium]